MRCTDAPSCLLSLRSTYSTLLFVSLLFLVALLSSPSTAQSTPFDPTHHYTLVLGLLLDLAGSVEVENVTDVQSLFTVARSVASDPSFFVYPNASNGANTSLSVALTTQIRDTLCDPIKASLAAYDLSNVQYNVAALIGPPCSLATEATVFMAAMYALPQISFGATDDLLADATRFSWLLSSVGNDASRAGVVVQLLLHYGWKHYSVIAQKSTFGINVLQDLTEQGKNAGLTLVSSTTYWAQATNWSDVTSYVAATQQQGGHVFVVAADDATCQQLLLAAWRSGLMGPGSVWVGASAGCVDPSLPNAPDPVLLAPVLPGVFFVNASFDASSPAYLALSDAYADVINATSTPVIPYENLLLYDTLLTYLYGFQNLLYNGIAPGPKTGAALLAAVLANVSFQGVTGYVDYSPYDNSRIGVQYSVLQVNGSGGVVELATAIVIGQAFTPDMSAVPVYTYTATDAPAYWRGNGSVPVGWTPPVTDASSSGGGISISTQALTVIICIACLVGCCFLAGVSFVALWRAKTTKVMGRLSQALSEAERARRNEAEAYKAKSQFLANMSHEIRTPMVRRALQTAETSALSSIVPCAHPLCSLCLTPLPLCRTACAAWPRCWPPPLCLRSSASTSSPSRSAPGTC